MSGASSGDYFKYHTRGNLAQRSKQQGNILEAKYSQGIAALESDSSHWNAEKLQSVENMVWRVMTHNDGDSMIALGRLLQKEMNDCVGTPKYNDLANMMNILSSHAHGMQARAEMQPAGSSNKLDDYMHTGDASRLIVQSAHLTNGTTGKAFADPAAQENADEKTLKGFYENGAKIDDQWIQDLEKYDTLAPARQKALKGDVDKIMQHGTKAQQHALGRLLGSHANGTEKLRESLSKDYTNLDGKKGIFFPEHAEAYNRVTTSALAAQQGRPDIEQVTAAAKKDPKLLQDPAFRINAGLAMADTMGGELDKGIGRGAQEVATLLQGASPEVVQAFFGDGANLSAIKKSPMGTKTGVQGWHDSNNKVDPYQYSIFHDAVRYKLNDQAQEGNSDTDHLTEVLSEDMAARVKSAADSERFNLGRKAYSVTSGTTYDQSGGNGDGIIFNYAQYSYS